jgi:UDP-3-O-[3-hydroxymyristoyl] glucosamine N-acyltransferase
MADPRFYDNRGPFTLAEICAALGATLPGGVDGNARVLDLASLSGAGPDHLTFFSGTDSALKLQLAQTKAGFCFVPTKTKSPLQVPGSTKAIAVGSVQHTFATTVRLFYPESSLVTWAQQSAVDPSATLGTGVTLAPGVVIGPQAEVGEGTRVGPNSVIGRGVMIGRKCEIGSNCTIANAYVGDEVLVLPGAQIGQPGFGFASGPGGHIKIPQIGRVIVQDRVEIGACTTIDRGALGDTVIGEGTKIDNLVQIGHNTRIGRHDMIISQVGISGSCELGDFVVLAGQVGLADHVRIGHGARFAARTGVLPGDYKGAQDYAGMPAQPAREWMREMFTLKRLAKNSKRHPDG